MSIIAKNRDFFSKIFSRIDKRNMVIIVFGYLIVAMMILLSYRHPIYSGYKTGDVANQTVNSDYTFSYYDEVDIKKILHYIESSKSYYYYENKSAEPEFSQNLDLMIQILQVENEKIFENELHRRKLYYSEDVIGYFKKNRFFVSKYKNRFIYIYKNFISSYTVVDKIPEKGVGKGAILATRNGTINIKANKLILYPIDKTIIRHIITRLYPKWSSKQKEAYAEILINTIVPTAFIDAQKRKQIVDEELKKSRLQKIIKKGEVLIKKGEIIDSEKLSRILSYKDYRKTILGKKIAFNLILSLILYCLLIYELVSYESRTFKLQRNIVLALVFFIMSNLMFYLSYHIKLNFVIPIVVLIPFAFISMSLPDLIRNTRVSIILLIGYSLFFLFYPSFDILSFATLMFISLSTIYTSRLLKSRKDFFLVGAIISVINMVFALLYLRIEHPDAKYTEIGYILLSSGINGLTSAMLGLGLMPIFENLLNIPTKYKLLELSNPTTSKLLKSLKTNAPGTYNHSMLIGDMASEAAELLNIDHLLVRVGGYYHDIGKIDNPIYFIENQQDKNKHDDIKPTISVSVIKNHVKAGVELANQARLPEEIIDYIREHHGTTAISYFYHQAVGLSGADNVNIQDYEYTGPLPHTKGAAIVLIADTVEAIVRAYSQNNEKFSPKIIQEIIDDTIEKRISQGQLDNCDITMRELKIVKEAFLKFLSGYYHKRIDYQKSKKNAQ